MDEIIAYLPHFASYLGNAALIIYLFATKQNRTAQANKVQAEAKKISVEAEIELNKQALIIISSMQLEVSRLQAVIDDLGIRVHHLEAEGGSKDKLITELQNQISTMTSKCAECLKSN